MSQLSAEQDQIRRQPLLIVSVRSSLTEIIIIIILILIYFIKEKIDTKIWPTEIRFEPFYVLMQYFGIDTHNLE